MNETIFTEKKKFSKMIKDFFGFKTKHKSIGLITLSDPSLVDQLLDGLEILSADFVVKTETHLENKANIVFTTKIKKDLLMWFDFVVGDNELEELTQYFSKGITPILPQNNHLGSLLKDFDPMSWEGNGYFYLDKNKWALYASIIKYLENYKFPYDNRNLVKNVLSI